MITLTKKAQNKNIILQVESIILLIELKFKINKNYFDMSQIKYNLSQTLIKI
jgi:hypothetical protein